MKFIKFLSTLFIIFFSNCLFSQFSYSQIDNSSLSLSSNIQAWEEDLQFLVTQIEQIHPNPYHGINQAEFQQAYEELYENLPQLTDDQIIVELMRLFGLLSNSGKEGHSGVNPQLIFEMLPIYLYRFEDGWFVMNASEEYNELIGARVDALAGVPIADVVEAVSPLVAKDNDTNLIIRLPRFLVMPELLSALGLTTDSNTMIMSLVLVNGESVIRTIAVDTSWPYPFRPPQDEELLWLSNTNTAWWLSILDEEKALYVQYNLTLDISPEGETLDSFIDNIISTFDSNELERLIIDVRLNGGGDNTTFAPLVTALKNHSRINRAGSLYALIGRGTFSAAGNFITVLEKETNVILVGEPTGGGPNQFGDAVNVELPNHPELIIRLASVYHEFDSSDLNRLTHEPFLRESLRSEDYFNHNDPVLERALFHRP